MARFVAAELAPSWGIDPTGVRVATVFQEASFTRSLADEARAEALRLGLSVPFHEAVDGDAEDFGDLIDRLALADPHVVIVATYSGPTPNLYRQSVERGFRPPAWFGTGSWALHQKVADLGTLLDGIFAAGTPHLASVEPRALSAEARHRFAAWKARTSIPHDYATAVDRDLSVIALELLLTRVLPSVETWEPDAVRDEILALDLPLGTSMLGYGVKFTPEGNNERTFAAIMQWQDGRLETVAPDLIATAEPDLDTGRGR
jgi:branched-chain amino acid transport system substrate-binding protein